jgi:hypothetical protein
VFYTEGLYLFQPSNQHHNLTYV